MNDKAKVARDLRGVLADLKKIENTPGMDPLLVELVKRMSRVLGRLRKLIVTVE